MLKNQVEWALHCCSILSGVPEGKFLSTKTLAQFHGVPKEYLSKALQGLSQAGLVIGTLGPSGGYRLARAPHDITFLQIVEAVEGRSSTFTCTNIRANNPCLPGDYCDTKPCAIAKVMWEADQAWRNKLSAVTLADLRQTLSEVIPEEIYVKSFNWLMSNPQS